MEICRNVTKFREWIRASAATATFTPSVLIAKVEAGAVSLRFPRKYAAYVTFWASGITADATGAVEIAGVPAVGWDNEPAIGSEASIRPWPRSIITASLAFTYGTTGANGQAKDPTLAATTSTTWFPANSITISDGTDYAAVVGDNASPTSGYAYPAILEIKDMKCFESLIGQFTTVPTGGTLLAAVAIG